MSVQGDLMAELEKWDALAWMGEAEWKDMYEAEQLEGRATNG